MNGSVGVHPDGVPAGLGDVHRVARSIRVEQAGVPLRLFVIKPVEEREHGHRHPVVDAIAATPEYLPDPAALTAPLHRWRARHLRRSCPRCGAACAAPARARAGARDRARPDRPRPPVRRCAGPRKIYLKELLQAIALADRLLDAPDVRHLHAHFAHGTTTVTWLAARITGLPFSFTGHARDIYAGKLNRHGLAAAQAARRALRRSPAPRRTSAT